MITYTVQDCGCIALPEELQEQTGLRPGATFQISVSGNGRSVTLNSIRSAHRLPQSAEIPSGAACGKPGILARSE